ncbi:hypothetical protein AX15_000452 [Amanita polypyramis BW_CC]|nr:hypothetical protein AX15_000452 [Amanita polypyramis BW_CC]
MASKMSFCWPAHQRVLRMSSHHRPRSRHSNNAYDTGDGNYRTNDSRDVRNAGSMQDHCATPGTTEQWYSEVSDIHYDRHPGGSREYDHHARNLSWPTAYDGHSREMHQSYYSAGSSSSAYAMTSSHSTPYSPPIQKRQSSPSPEYVNATLEPSTQLEDPASKRKLLILDLNGTLVFRSPHRRRDFRSRTYQYRHQQWGDDSRSGQKGLSYEEPFNPYADPYVQRSLRSVHPRPFMPSLREYIFHPKTRTWLDVMVWSSAQPHSVADMVEQCFGDEKHELLAVWARDTLGLSQEEYNRKTQTTKDLTKPWTLLSPKILALDDQSSLSLPTSTVESRTVHSPHTTLLLDDSHLKAHLQPWNHICIREYVAETRAADLQAAQDLKLQSKNHIEKTIETSIDVKLGAEDRETDTVVDKNIKGDMETGEIGEEDAGKLDEDQPEEINQRKRKRQPKKKLKALRQRMTSTMVNDEGDTEERDTHQLWRRFDCTLLAVIGILSAVKRESNVAAWVRQGGLWKGESGAEESATASIERESSTETQDDPKRKTQRRKSVGGSEEVTGDASVQQELWFDDESTMVCWVSQGVEALRELDIEIDVGIRVS